MSAIHLHRYTPADYGPANTDAYRAVTAHPIPYTFTRKHCTCGVRITAKDVARNGGMICDGCVRVGGL